MRLADVIAAIQAMGTYKFYKLDIRGWAKRISGNESDCDYWYNVIEQHPEFFRLNTTKDKASLVLRRNYQRTFHVDKNIELTREECNALSEEELNERVSRVPLSNSDIALLVNTAISLHARALEKEKSTRWWFAPIMGLLGVTLGVLLQKYM